MTYYPELMVLVCCSCFTRFYKRFGSGVLCCLCGFGTTSALVRVDFVRSSVEWALHCGQMRACHMNRLVPSKTRVTQTQAHISPLTLTHSVGHLQLRGVRAWTVPNMDPLPATDHIHLRIAHSAEEVDHPPRRAICDTRASHFCSPLRTSSSVQSRSSVARDKTDAVFAGNPDVRSCLRGCVENILEELDEVKSTQRILRRSLESLQNDVTTLLDNSLHPQVPDRGKGPSRISMDVQPAQSITAAGGTEAWTDLCLRCLTNTA